MSETERAAVAAAKTAEWKLPLWMVKAYVAHVDDNRSYATALMMALSPADSPDGEAGMLVALSTAASTRIHHKNVADHKAGLGIQDPSWKHFELRWHKNLAFMNWSGLREGQKLKYLLGDFFRGTCLRKGIGFPDQAVFSGPERAPLRVLLRQLVPVWAEITIGASFHSFRALDVYMRVFGSSIVSPPMEARYLLNTQAPSMDRILLGPEEWFMCDDWVSVGQQKHGIADWDLEHVGVTKLRARL